MNAVPGDQCEVEEFLNQSHGDTGVPEEETAFTEGQKQRQFHELRFLRRWKSGSYSMGFFVRFIQIIQICQTIIQMLSVSC